MDRRRFLQLLGLGAGAVAVEQVIPLGRVWSFPKNIIVVPPGAIRLDPGDSLRFVREWDAYEARVLCRFDVLYGLGNLTPPRAVDSYKTITATEAMNVNAAEIFPEVPPLAIDMLKDEIEKRSEIYKPRGMVGVHFPGI